jgi:hypothetical protein
MLWEPVFFAPCDAMRAAGETARRVSDRVELRWWATGRCPFCRRPGVFTAHDLTVPDAGGFEGPQAVAQYCPGCRLASASWYYDLHNERYLPVLRRHAVEAGPGGFERPPEPCPGCGGGLCRYAERTEGNDSWAYTSWHVCPNPGCDWPGRVGFDSGPFGWG